MVKVADNNITEVNQYLKEAFRTLELDIAEIWQPKPDDLELENRRLANILDWVEAYQRCSSRAFLEKQGYMYPPVDPCMDPDQDWLMFERWMQHKALRWKYSEEVGELRDQKSLSDHEIIEELAKIQQELEKRGVVFDTQDHVPPRVAYMFLHNELMQGEPFDYMAPGGNCHIGCKAYCPGCVQRPWCEIGQDTGWREDNEAGSMALPEEVKPYIP